MKYLVNLYYRKNENLKEAEFVELKKTFVESENTWLIDALIINQLSFILSAKGPNKKE